MKSLFGKQRAEQEKLTLTQVQMDRNGIIATFKNMPVLMTRMENILKEQKRAFLRNFFVDDITKSFYLSLDNSKSDATDIVSLRTEKEFSSFKLKMLENRQCVLIYLDNFAIESPTLKIGDELYCNKEYGLFIKKHGLKCVETLVFKLI